MDIIYFTLAAMVLYVGSDWILNKMEKARGGPFKNRSLIFFAIILALSMSTFSIIDYLTRTPPASSEPTEAGSISTQP